MFNFKQETNRVWASQNLGDPESQSIRYVIVRVTEEYSKGVKIRFYETFSEYFPHGIQGKKIDIKLERASTIRGAMRVSKRHFIENFTDSYERNL